MLKNKKKMSVLILTIVFALAMFAGCGGGGGGGGDTTAPAGDTPATETPAAPSGGAPDTIKIGIPNPDTGPLAGFGEGTPWAEMLVVDAINNAGGIYLSAFDTSVPIEAIFINTESDATKAAEVTAQLIDKDGVDLLIARHTPGTALPVSAMAETRGVPFVSLECPVNPWLAGGPYEWGFHSFWMVEDNCTMFMDMWEELGFGEGTKVGGIFPNDPDGLAWQPIFEKMLPERGFELTALRTEMMQNDWTNVINDFKAAGVQIVTGVPITPDFAGFSAAAIAQGLNFEIATMGRAFLFPSDAEANDASVIPKLTNEVWWSPWHPWTSSIDGMTCQELADAYVAEIGKPWSAPMGYKYAGMEIAVDALKRAGDNGWVPADNSLDNRVILRDAIGATDLDTMIGHIKYDPVTHVSLTDIVGGQWRVAGNRDDGSPIAEIDIVFNKTQPLVPLNGQLNIPG